MTTKAPESLAVALRRTTGAVGNAKGQSAEIQVERYYERAGARCLARRWRGTGSEIDLVFSRGDEIVFVEVKSGKTRDMALKKLTQRQINGLFLAAQEFLDGQPAGSLTPMCMDVATVDGTGQIEILENALMAA